MRLCPTVLLFILKAINDILIFLEFDKLRLVFILFFDIFMKFWRSTEFVIPESGSPSVKSIKIYSELSVVDKPDTKDSFMVENPRLKAL